MAKILVTNPYVSLTAGGSGTSAIADTSTHTAAGDTLIWNGTQWVDYESDTQVRGFLVQNFPSYVSSANLLCVSQSLYVLKVLVPYNISVTGIVASVSVVGATLTSGQNLVTLYNQAGTKQADSADQSAVWTSTGTYAMALGGGPYAITGGPGSYCWVSVLSNGTTPASFRGTSATTPLGLNVSSTGSLTGAAMFAARNGTAVTATATITPSSNVATAVQPIWVALY